MAGFPSMPLFVREYLVDTVALSIDESGAYLHLLMHGWIRGGELPDDDRQLAAFAKCSLKKWRPIRAVLEPFYTIENGVWTNNRHVDWSLHPSRWPDGRWSTVRALVLHRDGGICSYCGTTDGPFDVDHVLARILGGTNAADNLVTACASCNRSKGAKLLEDWRA